MHHAQRARAERGSSFALNVVNLHRPRTGGGKVANDNLHIEVACLRRACMRDRWGFWWMHKMKHENKEGRHAKGHGNEWELYEVNHGI